MNRNTKGIRRLALAAAVLMSASAGSAMAACFESGVGCTDNAYIPHWALRQLSCQNLWFVRNTIYDENGYCFHTAKAQAVFSNVGCIYASGDQVPLNDFERGNVSRIRSIEIEKGC